MSNEHLLPDWPLIPKCPPPPPELTWLLEAPPETLLRLIDLLLAAERGELPWSSVLQVLRRSVEDSTIHDNILSTSLNQNRQQKVSGSCPGIPDDAPMAASLEAISGAAMLWFGRLSGAQKIVLIREGLQSGFVLEPLLVSSLREALIAATTSVSNP